MTYYNYNRISITRISSVKLISSSYIDFDSLKFYQLLSFHKRCLTKENLT